MKLRLAVWMCLWLSACSESGMIGKPKIIDGDTLTIEATRIRLYGIDAVENNQTCGAKGHRWPCGKQAKEALIQLVANREVACFEKDRDRYQRIVGRCFVDEMDLSAAMVDAGWAMAYRKYSKDYTAQEQRAKEAKRGIWQDTFEPPWIWRHSRDRE